MRIDRRFGIVVGCSLLWALLVATVFYRVTAHAGGRRGEPGKPLVVAALALPLGVVIGPESVKLTEVPESLFPKGGFSRKEDVLERPVVSPIEADEPVVEARIAAKGSGVGLGPMIPPGMRAISVRVNDVVGVAGFVLPGMRVDVLVTGHPPGRDDTVTTTVLQNVPVLSAGQTIQSDGKGQPVNAAVVTLLVTPAQAESVTLANSEGHIQLVLRNSTDRQVTPTQGRQLRELYAIERLAAPPAASQAPAPRKPPTSPRIPAPPEVKPAPVLVQTADDVIMIRGNQKSVEQAVSRTGTR
ncbi:MAG TPA: Flp pilus assembly protein CpaB [Bryobacteraceae bacterium]|nr:Flp pilus assembly protein CpaB [Bryobacteraceae bacterium]